MVPDRGFKGAFGSGSGNFQIISKDTSCYNRDMDETSLRERARRHDRDRFLCTLFAPADRRGALWALLAFNSEIARIPEQAHDPILGRMRIEWWRQSLDGVFDGTPPAHEVLVPLSEAVRRYGLNRRLFDDLLDGRERDQDPEPLPDAESLHAYVDRTSGGLAELWLAVLGETDAALAAEARRAWRAWALVGLVRAVPFHRAAGRAVLPASMGADDVLDLAERALAGLRRPPRNALSAFLPVVLAKRYLRFLRTARGDRFDGSNAGQVLRLVWAGMTGRV